MNALMCLYKNKIGRILLRPLISKPVSDLCGKVLDSRMSKVLIGPFIKKNSIRINDYQLDSIHSFSTEKSAFLLPATDFSVAMKSMKIRY